MSLLRIVVLGIIAYFAYRYYSWPGAVGVIGVYVVLLVVLGLINANRARQNTQQLLRQKLSEAEKSLLAAKGEQQQRITDHKAQFDPDLRKSRGQ
jgi:hypothetical protein